MEFPTIKDGLDHIWKINDFANTVNKEGDDYNIEAIVDGKLLLIGWRYTKKYNTFVGGHKELGEPSVDQ